MQGLPVDKGDFWGDKLVVFSSSLSMQPLQRGECRIGIRIVMEKRRSRRGLKPSVRTTDGGERGADGEDLGLVESQPDEP